MIVSIHQPNFFPWLGYFEKISRSDKFVFLDHVSATRTQAYLKRVEVLVCGKTKWSTIPLEKSTSSKKSIINRMKIKDNQRLLGKHINTLKQSYSKHPHFNEIFPLITDYHDMESSSISDRNINFIINVTNELGFDIEFVKSSDLNLNTSSTDMLIEILSKVGGGTYLCGGGAQGYQEDWKFKIANINLLYQDFVPFTYCQLGVDKFIPSLSIIDALMNIGFDGVRRILVR